MYKDGKILVGKSGEKEIFLNPSMANRHGMIAGATGTGKTVSLKVLAESFSDAGVPVFLADIKGDLCSLAETGRESDSLNERIATLQLDQDGYSFRKYPVMFWDVYGEMGMPLRTTISEMGPLLLSRVLGLNELQTDILSIVFKIADDTGLLLIDTKDLKSMLAYVNEHRNELAAEYGHIAPASIAAITRALVSLETQGADKFFGEPALTITDMLQLDSGQGVISVMDCRKLILNPDMYSTYLLWMLSELFESLPEVGDCPKPKMVFFFDEAHMLFSQASPDLLNKIEQIVKLIRSKGVGVFFITQNPADIPDGIMSQLGNKIQHALHAYSPKELKAVKAAAQTYRENPEFDTADAIQHLATGQALVSMLDESGIPGIVERCMILPPQSLLGTADDSLRDQMIKSNVLYSRYATAIDRDSAFEFLQRHWQEMEAQALRAAEEAQAEKERAAAEKEAAKEAAAAQQLAEKEAAAAQKAAEMAQREAEREQERAKKRAASVASTAAGTIGRQIGKSVGSLGGTFGKTLGGNIGAQLGRSILGTFLKL